MLTNNETKVPTGASTTASFKSKHPLGKFMRQTSTTGAVSGPVSPTDKMMSPCTAKIEQKRQMSHLTLKPKSLVSQFAAVKKQEQEEQGGQTTTTSEHKDKDNTSTH